MSRSNSDATRNSPWHHVRDWVGFVITCATFVVLLFELSVLNYQSLLNGAVLERTRVEALLSADKLDLALGGLAVAQQQMVPVAPGLLSPDRWFLVSRQPIFSNQLRDEVKASLRHYSSEYLAGTKPRLLVGNANLAMVDLIGAELVGVVLTGANLRDADLRRTHLDESKLGCADLENAKLNEVALIRAHLYMADLSGAKLAGANLSKAYLEAADFNDVDFTGAILHEVSLYGANLANANLKGVVGWPTISIRNANIRSVQNPPPGFVEWAKDNGAVEVDQATWQAQRQRAASCNGVQHAALAGRLGVTREGNHFMSTEAWASWMTAIGTLLLAITAALQDRIRAWIWRPRLALEADVSPPACHKTLWRDDGPCYYFRLRVTNTGNAEAKLAEVTAAQLRRRRKADGNLEDVPRFMPMNLVWSHTRKPFYPAISPGMPKFLDLAHVFLPRTRLSSMYRLPDVSDDKCVLIFDLEVEPNNLGHLIEPGEYVLDLIVGAANARPTRYRLEINFPGDWYDNETQMLSDGYGMRIL